MSKSAKTILLVEDDSLLAISETRWLKKAGYNVIHVLNGKEAINYVREKNNSIDLILMDIILDGIMDGVEAAQIILKERDLPVLFLSAHTEKEIVDRTKEVSSYGYILKNSEKAVPLAVINSAIKLHKVHSELKEKEKKLLLSEKFVNETERKYKLLFEQNLVGVYQTSVDGKIIDCNEAFVNMLGFSSFEEMKNSNAANFYDTPGQREEFIARLKEDGIVKNLEIVLKRKNGTFLYGLDNAVLLSTGNLVKDHFIFGTIADITPQKEIENELLRERYLMTSLLDNSPDRIYFKDKNSRFIRINKSQAKILSLNDPSEAIGKTDFDFFAEEHARQAFEDEQRVMKTGVPIIGLEEKDIFPDGREGWVYTNKMPLFDKDGNIVGTFGISRDINAYKNIEKELRHEQYLLNFLMDNIPDHIYFKDIHSRFIRINKAMIGRFGISKTQEAIGKLDFDFFSDEHAKQAYEDEQKILKTGNPIFGLEEKETWPDGHVTWVSSNKMPLRDKDGNIIGTFGISRDITEKKQADEKLNQYAEELKILNSTKDKLFSIIAHDLKNPFHSINSSLDLLITEGDSFTEKERKDFLINILNTSKKAYALLENLLQWSLNQMNKIEFAPEKLELNKLITESVNLLSGNASIKNIKIIEKQLNDVYVFADKNMLSSIIRNLLNNAIKFTPDYGTVEIESNIVGQNIEISVKDSGVGIPEKDIKKLFKIDQSFSTYGTRNEKGTGLGLILCKEFVEKNGGKLKVESEPGKGSKFTFTIPQG